MSAPLPFPAVQVPPLALLLWVLLFGLGLTLVLTAQPIGRPRPNLAERFRRLDAEARLREEYGTAVRKPIFHSPMAELLLRPMVDAAGERLGRALTALGLAPQADLAEQLAVVRPEVTPGAWYGEKLWTGVVVTLVVALLGWQARGALGPLPLLLWLVGFACGYFLPDVRLHRAIRRWRTEGLVQLSRLLDRLSLAVAAGLGLEQALLDVTTGDRSWVAQQFRRTVDDVRLNQQSLGGALEALSDHCGPLPDLASVARQLQAAHEQGLSLAHTLDTQAGALRERKRLVLVEAGGKATVTMLLPIALFVVPVLFILVLVPAADALLRFAS